MSLSLLSFSTSDRINNEHVKWSQLFLWSRVYLEDLLDVVCSCYCLIFTLSPCCSFITLVPPPPVLNFLYGVLYFVARPSFLWHFGQSAVCTAGQTKPTACGKPRQHAVYMETRDIWTLETLLTSDSSGFYWLKARLRVCFQRFYKLASKFTVKMWHFLGVLTFWLCANFKDVSLQWTQYQQKKCEGFETSHV